MATNISILSFSGGEASPQIDARSDVEKYLSLCRHLENFIATIYGAAVRRPGTKYIESTSGLGQGAAVVRFIPFIFSSEVAYVVELSDYYARFFDENGLIEGAYVIPPYSTADLFQIQYAQVGNVMWLVHPDYPPYKLTRTNDAPTFSIDEIVFTTGPFMIRNDLIGENFLEGEISGSAAYMDCDATTGEGVTLTCSNGGDGVDYTKDNVPFFVQEHIGALFKLTHPKATTIVKGTKSNGSNLPYGICTTNNDLNEPGIDIKGTFHFNTHGNWGGTIVLQRREKSAGSWLSQSPYVSWEDYRTYTSHYANKAGDRNVQLALTEEADNVQYRAVVTEWTDGTINADITVDSGTQDGIVRVTDTDGTEETPSATATVEVLTELAKTDPTRRWAEGAWSPLRGYPSSVRFFEERCVYGGMCEIPTQVVYTLPV